MSKILINQYYSEVDKLIQYGGSRKESSIRTPFQNLLNEYAKKKDLLLVAELDYKPEKGNTIYPDGTLKDAMRLDWGYWESKDEEDDINEEIKKKFAKGYPKSNILFEDSQTAILIQQGQEVMRVNVREPENLDKILTAFLGYERPEVRTFRDAIVQVKTDLPSVATALREMIRTVANQDFTKARTVFFELCKQSINPDITLDDINEMLIQHILTEDIFKSIYNESQYHEENNIAKELKKLENTFFTGAIKRNMLDKIRPYYQFIQEQGRTIVNHTEKKAFLNAVYEDFYKAYNPKMADKLGVVYTPQEIVKFMIESTEYLLDKHFNKTLSDKNVEILDPATGTGTFVCALIDHLQKPQLEYKYLNEIYANEVSILPYYIANLNIEYTFRQRMGKYEEFNNLCFVDTLDNISALKYAGKQTGMFGFSAENAERIKRQNDRKISVIIGNPPYNANQQNENDNNKNREYPDIDKRIKETYIKQSTAQKTKVYDMYARFYRWATDRLDKNGVLAFVTNRSFIDSRTFDGFRKMVCEEFNEIYIVDTKSDVRANPKIAGTTHNVFGIQTGVCLAFFVRNEKIANKGKIYYQTLQDEQRKEEKLEWFRSTKIQDIPFERIIPDEKGNWINQTDNDFESLIPVCSKDKQENTIFNFSSLGVSTNRDEWVYDFSKENLKNKIQFFINTYNAELEKANSTQVAEKQETYGNREIENWNESIKWSRDLKKKFEQKRYLNFNEQLVKESNYRPFTKQFWYAEKILNDILTQNHYDIFGEGLDSNIYLAQIGDVSQKPFTVLVGKYIPSLNYLSPASGCRLFPIFTYENGERKENITDWALGLFREFYSTLPTVADLGNRTNTQPLSKSATIDKVSIFHYVYAVLHNPQYRQKYEQNLKRDFPRIPLYEDFWQWASWGKKLMDLHLNYETASNYELLIINAEWKNANATPKPKLKANKELGEIYIDEATTLKGIPLEAWEYKLGNRSALEWVLDQYKESKPSDPTIAEKFNTYRFADYKTQVIDLLQKVCTVSVETMKVVREM